MLHISPEAGMGGPLSLVRNGDVIKLNVEEGLLELMVSAEELEQRKKEQLHLKLPTVAKPRGYGWLHAQHVLRAPQGCDFDFLRGKS